MSERGPKVEKSYLKEDMRPMTTWAEATKRLADGDTYWLATTRADGSPHVVPILAVWVDGAMHFVANARTRKSRNLSRDARCVLAAGLRSLDLVIEGEAVKVTDDARLNAVAKAYADMHEWPVEIRDGAFHGEGAPTAGPPPYNVYAIIPTKAFGFGTDESLNATRWTF
jgi:nitroimidazol reductase NimA-like FMN-containing flavoprotein (pyridoxamine 5'-phosphate oxidase superfamily)